MGEHLPKGEGSQFITDIMKKSYEILKDHPVNKSRIERGFNPANTLWIWGQGKKPSLSSFYDKYGIKGTEMCIRDRLIDIIRNNTRAPYFIDGDIRAHMGALNTAEKHFFELVEKYGEETVRACICLLYTSRCV